MAVGDSCDWERRIRAVRALRSRLRVHVRGGGPHFPSGAWLCLSCTTDGRGFRSELPAAAAGVPQLHAAVLAHAGRGRHHSQRVCAYSGPARLLVLSMGAQVWQEADWGRAQGREAAIGHCTVV